MFFSRVTVYEGQAGLRFDKGKLVGVLSPGFYRVPRTSRVDMVTVLPQTSVVGGQEVMVRDGGAVRLSLILTTQVVDARSHYLSGAVPPGPRGPYDVFSVGESHLHQSIQVAVRIWAAVRTLEEAIEQRESLPDDLMESMQSAAAKIGCEVLDIQLLDFQVAGGLKSAHADLLKAELEGKAAMVRARNEASTMRSLINTAKLVRDHPGLLELRVLTSGQKPRVNFSVGTDRKGSETANLPEDTSI